MAPVYRDHELAMRRRLEDVEARLRAVEEQLTPVFWRVVPSATAQRLRQLRDSALSGSRQVAERFEYASEYVSLLTETLESAQAAEASWRVLPASCAAPTPAAPTFPLGVLFGAAKRPGEESITQLRSRVRSIACRLDERAELGDFGRWGVRASLRFERAPVVLAAAIEGGGRWTSGGALEVQITARTSVSRGAAELRLTPRGHALQLVAFFGARHRSSTGDPAFDGWFEVDAEPGAARHLLGPEVRAALCVVAKDDAPTLAVSDGIAELRWRFEPSHATVRAAFEALEGIRRAPPLPLLRDTSRRTSGR